MIPSSELCQLLKSLGYDFFTGVPCSFFKAMIDQSLADPEVEYVAAANEGTAVGLAAGAGAGGRRPVVMLQNSGLGNTINPLTSLAVIYRQPMLLLVSGRAYKVADEPQHEVMGRHTHDFLDAAEVPHADLPADPDAVGVLIRQMTARAFDERRPVAVVVPKGTVGKGDVRPVPELGLPMSRRDAIAIAAELAGPDAAIVGTTGMVGRELYEVDDRPANFYMMGSMGHASAFALGAALARPSRRIVVLDGDGAAIMHMGTLSTIGHYAPKNLTHVILDNEAYESTGNQDTTASTTDLAAVARACAYRSAERVTDEASYRRALQHALASTGPSCVHVKVHRVVDQPPARITERWSAEQIASRFRDALRGAPID